MRRAVDWLGRSLITIGALLVLFVGYQLWGTGLVQAWEQRDLARRFDARLEERARAAPPRTSASTPVRAGPTPTSSTTTTTMPLPKVGDPVASLKIPAIGLDQTVVEGVDRPELALGPGHYPHSPLPGHPGNVAIAGHRTTHGAPFFNLDELKPGDRIELTTVEGAFSYVVTGQKIVAPSDVSVVLDQHDNRLTLTSCNPKYSAKERLTVSAALQGKPLGASPPPTTKTPVTLPGEDTPRETPRAAPELHLDGASESGFAATRAGTLWWTLGVMAMGAVWWWGFRRRPRWYTWLGGALPFLVVLFFFFGEVERILPANF